MANSRGSKLEAEAGSALARARELEQVRKQHQRQPAAVLFIDMRCPAQPNCFSSSATLQLPSNSIWWAAPCQLHDPHALAAHVHHRGESNHCRSRHQKQPAPLVLALSVLACGKGERGARCEWKALTKKNQRIKNQTKIASQI